MPVFGAQDPAASGEFYVEVLGLEVVMDRGWIITFAAPGNPAAQISLMTEDASAPVQPDASIEVDDVDAAHAAAQRLGGGGGAAPPKLGVLSMSAVGTSASIVCGRDARERLVMVGTGLAETFIGTGARDRIYPHAGNHTVPAAGGKGLVHASAGNDRLNGGAGADMLFGGKGSTGSRAGRVTTG